MLQWILTAAFAAPTDADEEVIVYGDNFARWDETRWLVQAELWVPLGVLFASDENKAFESNVFQVRSVVFCRKDAKLSKKKWEVSCTIEDLGLLVTSARNWRRERDRVLVQEVLDEVDRKLTGIDVQLQVDENGGVTNFDLEGIDSSNLRERRIQETLRQVVSRTMSGFHLRIPDQAQRSGQWLEYNSELMDMPSLTSSRGSTTMVHQVSPYQGLQLVQTVGEGTLSVNIPNRRPTQSFDGPVLEDAGSAGGSSASPGGALAAPAELESLNSVQDRAGAEMGIEATYRLGASGVAVFRKSDGIMTERVWTVEGSPTASSAGGVDTGPFRNAGRIRLLGQEEKVDVGPTEQVAFPGKVVEGLDMWVPLETLPGSGAG